MDIPVLETERLLLRPVMQEDLATIRPLWQNEQVQRFEGGIFPAEIISARLLLLLTHWQQHGFGLWCVCEKERGQVIGLCGLEVHGFVELVYRLSPEYWGHGYATEATAACLTYAFQTLHLERVIGFTQEANRASQRVLEKVGMRYSHSFHEWDADQYWYELTQAQWLESQ